MIVCLNEKRVPDDSHGSQHVKRRSQEERVLGRARWEFRANFHAEYIVNSPRSSLKRFDTARNGGIGRNPVGSVSGVLNARARGTERKVDGFRERRKKSLYFSNE